MLELGQVCVDVDRDVGSRSGRHREVPSQDRRALIWVDLFQANLFSNSAPDHGSTMSRPNVANPTGVFAEHRHEVLLAVRTSSAGVGAPGGSIAVTVNCAAGEIATGGGVEAADLTGNDMVEASMPVITGTVPTGWQVNVWASQAAPTAYVICAPAAN